MQIRPMQPADLDRLADVDGTMESSHYLHLNETGAGVLKSWVLEERPLREKRIEANPISDELHFILKQIVIGADEGLTLVGEHEAQLVAMLVARPDPEMRLMRLIDLRVDYDFRRQGVGTGLLFHLIRQARQADVRAVAAETRTDNSPANSLLTRLHFELTGIDTHRHSNHDLVQEAATLFWYIPLSE